MSKKPPLTIQPTTLWDYPSQHYGNTTQGDPNYRGATPSYVIWNCLQRYTHPGNLVVDPCCGSGTTIDVCNDTDRRGMGFDLAPSRPDIKQADARDLPLEDQCIDFVFIDPPYSTHLDYSDDPRCIGKLHVKDGYYEAMEKVFAEIDRILKPNRHVALYVSDSYEHGKGPGKGFHPLGFELFRRLRRHFIPVDIISVVRHNKTLEMGNYRKAAEEENFFLRGFNYLFILKKSNRPATPRTKPRSAREQGKGQHIPPTQRSARQGPLPNDAPHRIRAPRDKDQRGGHPSGGPKGPRPPRPPKRGKPPRK
jgi:adenine-specific DNA-methyltransferase